MDKVQNHPNSQDRKRQESSDEKKRLERKIDEELEQSFPASDPPSYSQPGNDDIKNGCKEGS